MRTVKFSRLIDRSIERTKVILFQPISWKKWLKLLFIASLAGALGTGGPSSGGGGGGDTRNDKQEAAVIQSISLEDTGVAHAQEDWSEESGIVDNQKLPFDTVSVILVVVTIVLILCFVLLATWISSRFKFIWFNAVAVNEAKIVDPFKRYKMQGNSVFKFAVICLFVFLFYLGLMGLWVYSAGHGQGVWTPGYEFSIGGVFQAFGLPLVIFLFSFVFIAAFNVFFEHIIVSIMVLDESRFIPAWHKFVALFNAHTGDMILYLFVLMGLGIACGIIGTIIAILLLLVLLLAALILFGLSYLFLVSMMKANVVFTIVAIILGVPFAVVALLLLMSTGLPFAVFFKSLALYYLTSLNAGYTVFVLDAEDTQSYSE